MIFAIHRPRPPLEELIQQFWYYEGLDVPYDRERVLPDGSFHLMFNLSDQPRRLFDPLDDRRIRDFRTAWVSGAHREFIVIDAQAGSSLIGVQFKPGGATRFLGLPATVLRDDVQELEAVLPGDLSALRDRLRDGATSAAKFAILEAFLLQRWAAGRAGHPSVAHALERFRKSPHSVTVDAVAREVGVSHKHFIARFEAEVGVTPKRFCRIRRFQGVLAAIGRKASVDWADLACACGYYDQAHFIQEFRAFSGINPSTYLRERGEYVGYVPFRK
ncbi:MAG: helix-turn-helix transcriptional regulator [Verrucomicrobia bacterium]|nr:helix-turn-helix transcriptional regulator [Verrucomicrobiota bacterium]